MALFAVSIATITLGDIVRCFCLLLVWMRHILDASKRLPFRPLTQFLKSSGDDDDDNQPHGLAITVRSCMRRVQP
jgi:hypothetical protein